ncbi:MAG: hypothetical protein LBF63_05890, partial [Treponema sp.]|nr:hypothetical protein [Treponema sp.]
HLGIYPGDLTLSPFIDKLDGYKHTKGAIQFPYDKPIDYDLIAEIVQYKVKNRVDTMVRKCRFTSMPDIF